VWHVVPFARWRVRMDVEETVISQLGGSVLALWGRDKLAQDRGVTDGGSRRAARPRERSQLLTAPPCSAAPACGAWLGSAPTAVPRCTFD
jgi:hypothetical protein